MRVLHVEDNRTDADLIRRHIAQQSPEILLDQAVSFEEARQRLSGPEVYDVALIDLRLPDGDGLDLLALIRERHLPIAVVMLTGSGDQESAVAALQAGADDYIVKQVEAYERLPTLLRNARKRFHDASKRRARPLQVLYAEHNPADVDLTRRHLRRRAPHIRLTIVSESREVLDRLPTHRGQPSMFDVVLLDYRLPGVNALEAIKIIRVDRQIDIPIVMVSGQGSEAIAAQAIHLGVDDYIAKHPGYLHELPATLEKVHRQYELLREQGKLRETYQRLTYLLAASPVILFTLRLGDDKLSASWVSGNISQILGYSVQEALTPNWWIEHIHPDDCDRVVAELRELSNGRGRLDLEYRFYDRRGQTRWIHDEMRAILGDEGQVLEIIGAWRDVSDAKRAELVQQTRISALDQVVGNHPLPSILSEIARRLEAIRPDMRVSVLVRESRSGRLYTGAAPSLPDEYNRVVDGLEPGIGHGSCGTAAATGEPVIVEDVKTHPYWKDFVDIALRTGIRACWSVPFMDDNGEVIGTFAIYYDQPRSPQPADMTLISEFARIAGLAVQRVRADEALRQAATVFKSTREGVLITDLTPRILATNQAFTEITGFTEEEVIGKNPNILQSGRQGVEFFQAMWACMQQAGHWRGEIWNRRKNGELYPQLLTVNTVYDSNGKPSHYVGVMTDISQLKQSEARLDHLAHYDPLTDLPNRLLIQSRLDHALERAERQHGLVAVLFIDLDRFKNVNDSLGHPAGDELLEILSQRMRSRLREQDSLGRLGGDEFLLVLEGIQRPSEVANVAHNLIQLLERPVDLSGGHHVYVGASIGISLYPQNGKRAIELIQHADAAMYQAKEHGRNTFRFYTPALTRAVNERMDLEARIRRALSRDEFELHYQPQVDIRSGNVIGCEALVRWNDPEQGIIQPDRFIPIAEETGLIVPLGEAVLRNACLQARAWIEAGIPFGTIAVNLSGRQLQRDDLVSRVSTILAETGMPVERIQLELTESMIMGHGEEAVTLLRRLKDLGPRLSIDDFGTGYSSLAYLKRFPIDELKIDRGFVRDIPGDSSDMEIAATIIAMARNLKLNVLAEGVETEEQLHFLACHGCHAYQGYLFSKPLPPKEFVKLLRAYVRRGLGEIVLGAGRSATANKKLGPET